jgi:hypothetical protein
MAPARGSARASAARSSTAWGVAKHARTRSSRAASGLVSKHMPSLPLVSCITANMWRGGSSRERRRCGVAGCCGAGASPSAPPLLASRGGDRGASSRSREAARRGASSDMVAAEERAEGATGGQGGRRRVSQRARISPVRRHAKRGLCLAESPRDAPLLLLLRPPNRRRRAGDEHMRAITAAARVRRASGGACAAPPDSLAPARSSAASAAAAKHGVCARSNLHRAAQAHRRSLLRVRHHQVLHRCNPTRRRARQPVHAPPRPQ